jgi:hypothetical protein
MRRGNLRCSCFTKTGTGVPCPYNLRTRLGGGALGVQGHYLLGYLFYVGDAE